MNILIIEDNKYLAGKIKEVFEENILTNRVECVYSYYDFLNKLSGISSYDIVLTDIILGDDSGKTGRDIVKIIRKKDLEIPIVIISSISTYDSLENAFSIGANDYIIKPFRIRELEIRVNKWFHDYVFSVYFTLNKQIKYHELVYNISQSEYSYSGEKLNISRSSKYLLSLFMIQSEKLISERFLIEKIWGDNGIEDKKKNIRICVMRLKNQLEEVGIDSWIQNIRGEGYILRKVS